jgi:hypothetical protein
VKYREVQLKYREVQVKYREVQVKYREVQVKYQWRTHSWSLAFSFLKTNAFYVSLCFTFYFSVIYRSRIFIFTLRKWEFVSAFTHMKKKFVAILIDDWLAI